MNVPAGPPTGNGYVATPLPGQSAPEWPLELASSLVLPAHSSSIRLGRHVVFAWLQFAPDRYDVDTALLLVTELLASAVEYSSGPLLLSVAAREGQVRVEVKDVSPVDGILKTTDLAEISDAKRHLKMVTLRADRWGSELRLTDDDVAVRVVWFECDPIASESRPSA